MSPFLKTCDWSYSGIDVDLLRCDAVLSCPDTAMQALKERRI
jgi:hypothetical protein